MRKNHRVQKAKTAGDWRSSKKGKCSEQIGPEENSAQNVEIGIVAEVEPVRDEALNYEPAGKSIESEKPRQFPDDGARSFHAELARVRNGRRLRLDGRRQKQKQDHHHKRTTNIPPNQKSVTGDGRQRQRRWQANGQRAQSSQERTYQIVSGEYAGAMLIARCLGKNRLFDREKRSNFFSRRADGAENRGGGQEYRVMADRKNP